MGLSSVMQLQLPIFQDGTHLITRDLGCQRQDGQITYLQGVMPVFVHSIKDVASFQMISSQFYVNGIVKQMDIVRAFGIKPLALKRWVKKYREEGPGGFYIEKRGRPRKKKPDKVVENDLNRPAQTDRGSSKSERSREDAAASSGLGVGTTDSGMRVLGALGKIQQAPSEFHCCDDVCFGGVLFALPALLACGLLRHGSRFFALPAGYYSLTHILMLLAFMALCRIRSIEDLRYTAPGEWGKLLGLDRCPEAKTLREKLKILTSGNPEEGSAQLCEDWMEADAANVGTLYIDGHSRVYHGHQTKLPRHYVARQRLCLRATSDYWVNGLDAVCHSTKSTVWSIQE